MHVTRLDLLVRSAWPSRLGCSVGCWSSLALHIGNCFRVKTQPQSVKVTLVANCHVQIHYLDLVAIPYPDFLARHSVRCSSYELLAALTVVLHAGKYSKEYTTVAK